MDGIARCGGPSVEEALPVLRADVWVGAEGAALQLGDEEYRFVGIERAALCAVISQLNGVRSVDAIAAAVGLPTPTVASTVKLLLTLGLAVDLRRAPATVDGKVFASACRKLFPAWKDRLFAHPLWVGLTDGSAARAQFLGWVLESFHFIHGVSDRLPLTVATCPDVRVRALLARHYSEEYDHGRFFLDALAALGISREAALAARPLPGTRAVLDFMRRCARRDTLQYAVCSGFLESTGGDRLKARSFYECLARYYDPERTGAMEPLIAHVNLDEAYGHNALMEQVAEFLGPFGAARASAALDAAHGLVETLELWSEDILRAYRTPSTRGEIDGYRTHRVDGAP